MWNVTANKPMKHCTSKIYNLLITTESTLSVWPKGEQLVEPPLLMGIPNSQFSVERWLIIWHPLSTATQERGTLNGMSSPPMESKATFESPIIWKVDHNWADGLYYVSGFIVREVRPESALNHRTWLSWLVTIFLLVGSNLDFKFTEIKVD